jgi:sigma-B regulation protein RsbU (phosphoserine phosphatase)
MPRLQVTLHQPGTAPLKLDFERDVITIGRDSSSEIRINNRYLSRKHAEIAADGDGWLVRDNGSVNGTYVNGARIRSAVRLGPGDHIQLGDSELVIGGAAPAMGAPNDTVVNTDFVIAEAEVKESAARTGIIHRLALELIADRPMADLFDFILDRVVDLMQPSRAALALLSDDGQSVKIVTQRSGKRDGAELAISRTLIREVVQERKVVVFKADSSNTDLTAAKSIVVQMIYSALCAPLIAGESVLGVLYIDYQLNGRSIREEDAQLAAQIARVAAIKLESTRLRDAALEKGKLDETLKLAHSIQMRMLPQVTAPVAGSPFDIAAAIRPATEVGGDFYDFHVTAEGKLYFCIGDVSGKGIPAALMMAVSRALFRSFTVAGRAPAAVMSAVNRQLCDETDETMFVTAFCGVLDLASGEVRCANAGHNPPLIVRPDGTLRPLGTRPGLVLGYLPDYTYAEEITILAPGELLFLYTDGISEATNINEELFSETRLESVVRKHATEDVRALARATLAEIEDFVGGAPQSDDLTLLCIRYLGNVMPTTPK